MILATHGIVSSISGFDADYQAVLNYATSLGYTLPSSGQSVKQNKLLVDLKTAGIWSKLDSFSVFATDGSSNFALIDWKRLSLMTAVNSPTFTSNQGFTGNGTSSYVDTNFNLLTNGVNYKDSDASRYMYLYSGTNAFIEGVAASGTYNRILLSNSTNQSINSDISINLTFSYSTAKGIKSIHRTSISDISLYNDKVGATRTALYETPLRSVTQLILRRSVSYSNNQISMYAMGASLVSQNDSFVDAFNTYMNSL